MSLKENINRIKQVMGILTEQNTNEVKSQLEWLRNYISSPMYIERLKKEFPGKDIKFIENERNVRLANIENAEYRTHFVKSIGSEPGYISGMAIPKKFEGMRYDYQTKKWVNNAPVKDVKGHDIPGHVYLEKEYDPKTWGPNKAYEAIPAHEYSHLADDGGYRIPFATKKKIYDYTKNENIPTYNKNYKSGNLEFGYESTPSEFIGRMQSVRYLLNKLKIYDARTNKFTENEYTKMINNPTIRQDVHFQDIFKTLKGDDNQKKSSFIDLMNTIAYQPTQNTSSQA